MIYFTGDTHGDFTRIEHFCATSPGVCKSDIMVVLGDAGINYFGGRRDAQLKERLARLPITLFCLHGNHEMRPESIASYKEICWSGGTVYREDEYPSLLFAKDGELYDLDGLRAAVIGGAYSVDKHYRLARGRHWFADEQPSGEIRARVEQNLAAAGYRADLVLTHTCPFQYRPTEVFLEWLDQSTVDSSTEEWLATLEQKLECTRWVCGHFHTDKEAGKLRFFYHDIASLDEITGARK